PAALPEGAADDAAPACDRSLTSAPRCSMHAASDKSPWLAHYDAGVPRTLMPYPRRTLLDYLVDAAREHPRDPALQFKGATMPFAELERLSDACAAALSSLGVTHGDRVALLLPNCPQFLVAEF